MIAIQPVFICPYFPLRLDSRLYGTRIAFLLQLKNVTFPISTPVPLSDVEILHNLFGFLIDSHMVLLREVTKQMDLPQFLTLIGELPEVEVLV